MKLEGKKIQRVSPHYENIYIYTGEKEGYFISSEELVKILSKYDFDVEKKRTRNWLHVRMF